jgi:tetratricopeptide (TPR) repeat protein
VGGTTVVETRHAGAPGTAESAFAEPAPLPGRSRTQAWRWGGLGIGILAAAALLITLFIPRKSVEAPLILVTGYEPVALGSSYPALGDILADWVAFSLGSTGRVQVVDGSTRIHTLLHLRDEGIEEHTRRVQMLAHETGARWLLTGEYFRSGDSLAVVTRVSHADSDDVVHSFRTATHTSEDPSALVDRVARQALEWVHASAGSGRGTSSPDGSSTPGYDAYVTYLTGAQHWVEGDRHLADPLFRNALIADPRLAEPMAWLIGALDPTWPWQWRDSLAESLASRAAVLPPADRALLGWWQARRGEDPAEALAAARAWVSAAPASSDAKWWTAEVAVELGQSEAAAELFEQVRAGIDRISAGVTRSAVSRSGSWAFHEVGDYPAELAWLSQFEAEPYVGVSACQRAVAVRALMEPDLDFDEAASRCASESSAGSTLLAARLRLDAARELRAHGALGHAHRLANEAILEYESALGNALPPLQAATYWGFLGELRLLIGDWSGSREAFTQAIALGGDLFRRRLGGLGVALALSGERAESEMVLDSLRARVDQPWGYEQAQILASLGQHAEANAILAGLSPRIYRAGRLRYDVAFDGLRSASGAPR